MATSAEDSLRFVPSAVEELPGITEAAVKKLICHICNDLGGWGKGFVLALSRRWEGPEPRAFGQ
jgi:hypothetical protein